MLKQIPCTEPLTAGRDKGYAPAISWPNATICGSHPTWRKTMGGEVAAQSMRAPRATQAMPVSQQKKERIEECFGWLKTFALLLKVHHRAMFKVDWVFTFACAAMYNFVCPFAISSLDLGQCGRSRFGRTEET